MFFEHVQLILRKVDITVTCFYKVENLFEFLRREVEAEENMLLSETTFGQIAIQMKIKIKYAQLIKKTLLTTANLINIKPVFKDICDCMKEINKICTEPRLVNMAFKGKKDFERKTLLLC